MREQFEVSKALEAAAVELALHARWCDDEDEHPLNPCYLHIGLTGASLKLRYEVGSAELPIVGVSVYYGDPHPVPYVNLEVDGHEIDLRADEARRIAQHLLSAAEAAEAAR